MFERGLLRGEILVPPPVLHWTANSIGLAAATIRLQSGILHEIVDGVVRERQDGRDAAGKGGA